MAELKTNKHSHSNSVTPENEPSATDPSKAKRRRRWLRWLGVLLAGMMFCYVFRAPILSGLARGLIIQDTLEATHAVAVFGDTGGAECLKEAARMYQEGSASQVLLFQEQPRRLVRMGILSPTAEISRQALEELSIPPEAITILRYSSRSQWDQIRRLQEWLHKHPQADVTVLVGEFESRKLAQICNQVLNPGDDECLHWRSLSDRRFDETNWWKSKPGVLAFADGIVRLSHVWLCGEPTSPAPEWDPDAYERNLTKGLAH